MSNAARKLKRAAKKAATVEGPAPDEVIGIDHPATTEAMVKRALPDGPRVALADVQAVGSLLVNSDLYLNAPVGGLRAIAVRLNAAVDRDFRAAQEANVKAGRPARP